MTRRGFLSGIMVLGCLAPGSPESASAALAMKTGAGAPSLPIRPYSWWHARFRHMETGWQQPSHRHRPVGQIYRGELVWRKP